MTFRPGLQALRGLAILLVLAFHGGLSALLPGGWIGVDLFFALSGYLISGLLVAEWRRTGTINVASFLGRRVRRLAPAMLAFLVVVVAATGSLWPLAYAYLANVVQMNGVALDPGTAHLWSLALEEQFYLVWPIVLLALLAIVPPRIVAVIVAVLALASLAEISQLGADVDRLYFGPDTHCASLMLGCAAGLAGFELRLRWALAPLLGALTVLVLLVSRTSVGDYTAYAPAIALVTVGIVVCSPALPRLRPLELLGDISYSLYLWHFFLLAAWGPWGLALSLPVAIASYQVIELPIRDGRLRWRAWRPVYEPARA